MQTILEQLWTNLETPILKLETGGCINEIRAYCREVQNNVWLRKDQHGLTLFNDLPPAPTGFQWREQK